MTPPLGAAIRYGLPGFALAFAALPLYLLTPLLYAEQFGISLAAVGVVLMLTRLIDAVTDPWIGRLIDRSHYGYWPWLAGGLAVMIIAMAFLVNPPVAALLRSESQALILVYLGLATLIVSVGNSFATLSHQGWAVAWTSEPSEQARLVGARETWALLGVITAAAITAQRSGLALSIMLAVSGLAAMAWTRSLAAIGRQHAQGATWVALPAWRTLFQKPEFRKLLSAYAINALANSIPATLVLFFIQDVIKLPPNWAGALLALYFLCAAIGVPLWTRLSARQGPLRTWLFAMLLATLAFGWALSLGEGDFIAFAVICVVTGLALGAELVCPPLLLGLAIERAGHRQALEASYFGVWNLASKLALAVAAGLALPALAWLGYIPGASAGSDARDGIQALQWVYAGLPCLLKLLAIMALALAYRQPRPLIH